jgi:hypothetical protein
MKHVFGFIAIAASLILAQTASADAVSPRNYTCTQLKRALNTNGYLDVWVTLGDPYRAYPESITRSSRRDACAEAGGNWHRLTVSDAYQARCTLGVICAQKPAVTRRQRQSVRGRTPHFNRSTKFGNGYFSPNGVYHSGDFKY